MFSSRISFGSTSADILLLFPCKNLFWALLFLCLIVCDSPGLHCFLQTSLRFLPHWIPFSFFINHLIAKLYRFSFKAKSHSNFLHCLHQSHNDCILLLDCPSSPCSFNLSTGRLGHVAGDTLSCTYPYAYP